jgi:3-hydroxyacyl-[acyl-carrier-protein] dehydratase
MTKSSLDPRAEILAAIPHRPPFLFVDRVVERGPGRIVTEWDVRADLPALQGHYPGRPIVPGVLVGELCFQSAAILCAEAVGAAPDAVPMLTRVAEARFKSSVGPGATLRAEIELEEALANARWFKAHVTRDGQSVLRVRFAVALVAGEDA